MPHTQVIWRRLWMSLGNMQTWGSIFSFIEHLLSHRKSTGRPESLTSLWRLLLWKFPVVFSFWVLNIVTHTHTPWMLGIGRDPKRSWSPISISSNLLTWLTENKHFPSLSKWQSSSYGQQINGSKCLPGVTMGLIIWEGDCFNNKAAG